MVNDGNSTVIVLGWSQIFYALVVFLLDFSDWFLSAHVFFLDLPLPHLPLECFLLIIELAKVDFQLVILFSHTMQVFLLLLHCLLNCPAVALVDDNFSPLGYLIYLFLLAAGHFLQFFNLLHHLLLLLLQGHKSIHKLINLLGEILCGVVYFLIFLDFDLDILTFITKFLHTFWMVPSIAFWYSKLAS